MNWLQKISQVNNLQQMLTEVAQGIRDVGQTADYFASLSPASPDICEMINAIGGSYPGAQASMGRIARSAGCQFDPNSGNDENMMPGMNQMSPPAVNPMEMPSVEIE